MTRLAEIPIRVELASVGVELDAPGGLGAGVRALLSELAAALDRLCVAEECTTLDLRSLPLSPGDRIELRTILGDGEIHATLHAQGQSTLRETSFSGIWWVEHRGSDGDLVADLLEVTRVPAILSSAPDEISAAARRLTLSIRPENAETSHTSRA